MGGGSRRRPYAIEIISPLSSDTDTIVAKGVR